MSWFWRREPARAFEAFQVEVTSRCNLKCVMCPVTVFAEHWRARDMSWETFERVAEAFARVRWVHLQGWGEPLLHRRIFDMIARAKSAGCKVGFTTNGTRLTAQKGARLLDLGLDLMAVSIAGATPATHAAIRVGSDLAKLAENLRRFLRLRAERGNPLPTVEVFYLMTPSNLAELPRAVELAAELGADELVAMNLDYVMTGGLDALRAYSGSPPARACREALDQARAAARRTACRPLPAATRRWRCAAQSPELCTSPATVVSPAFTSLAGQPGCRRVRGASLETPAVSFGNVNERPLMAIWESAPYREFRGRFAKRVAGAGLAMLGAAAGAAADEEVPAPEPCRTCPKLYGV
jgi:MoaA/NifB/PqqE/SkfB family radical SAM enzyme